LVDPYASSIQFKNRVFACPGGPAKRICTGSDEFKDLRKVRLILSYPITLSKICEFRSHVLLNSALALPFTRCDNILKIISSYSSHDGLRNLTNIHQIFERYLAI
jgi:hypothetical protein